VKGVIFIRFTDPRMQPVPFITRTPFLLLFVHAALPLYLSLRARATCNLSLIRRGEGSDILEDLKETKLQKTKYVHELPPLWVIRRPRTLVF
jgi:hypothetical protein